MSNFERDELALLIEMLKGLGWTDDEIQNMCMDDAVALLELDQEMDDGDKDT